MESCVHKHISEYLEENTIISEYQSGFKPTDSNINQLAYPCNEFAKAIDESKEIRVVFLDISKAFDRVWYKGRVAQSVTCLDTDSCLTAYPGVAS